MKNSHLIYFMLLTLGFSGCAILPPSQEMSDARQRLKAAYEMNADKYIPFYVWQAEEHINAAQTALEKGESAYKNARFHAHQAKLAATQAYQYALHFHETWQAVNKAASEKALWRDTEQLFDLAIEAAEQKNIEQALKLVGQAQQQAEAALIQMQVEKLRYKMQPNLPDLMPLNDAQRYQLEQAWLPLAKDNELGVEVLPGVYSQP